MRSNKSPPPFFTAREAHVTYFQRQRAFHNLVALDAQGENAERHDIVLEYRYIRKPIRPRQCFRSQILTWSSAAVTHVRHLKHCCGRIDLLKPSGGVGRVIGTLAHCHGRMHRVWWDRFQWIKCVFNTSLWRNTFFNTYGSEFDGYLRSRGQNTASLPYRNQRFMTITALLFV